MKKTKLNYVQLLFLITAFLTIQWTSTHVHFSENHNHDGDLHKHQIETHSHQYISNKESSFQVSHSNIIEFDPTYYKQNKKIEETSFVDVTVHVFNFESILPVIKLDVPLFINKRQGYSLYSSSNPRAPPLNS